jgi:hypothetical protein
MYPNTPKEQPEIERTCGTCAEWSRCTDARMANHGECEYRGVGHYSHELSPCLLTPSCWRKNVK